MAFEINPQLSDWQAEERELCLLQFRESALLKSQFPLQISAHYLPIAKYEADLLCINQADESVVALDHEVEGRIFAQAASSQTALVSALLKVDAFIKSDLRDPYFDDEDECRIVAEECAMIAGGGEFFPFYHSLIG